MEARWRASGNFQTLNANVVPCASPFDPIRKRMKLVGFLLHPIPRSETWRRLFIFQALFRAQRQILVAEFLHLADAPQNLWRESHHASRTSKRQQVIVTDLARIPKSKNTPAVK
jgi:hypothetical protein